jgi:dTDP-4-dehydrorhamnose 3,5-epimerase
LEAKVVACTAGAIWDVGVDLRPGSSTKYQYFGALLTPDNGQSLIVPEGFGHAFITLEPNSTVVYVNSSVYALEYESGICFDDPLLNNDWPIEPIVISDKDQSWGSLESRMQEID